MPIKHIVVQGENLSRIARAYDLKSWRDIYDHPDNAAYREKRTNPNIIFPGDVVLVPVEREEQVYQTGQRYTFEAKYQYLRLVIQDQEGAPLAGKSYELTIDGETETGTITAEGKIEARVKGNSQRAELQVLLDDESDGQRLTWTLWLDHLDPIEELSGIQARLNNLCFESGPVDGIIGPLTRAGVRAFQQRYDLAVDGIPGPNTQAKLQEVHGS